MKKSVRITMLAGLAVIFMSLTACKEKIELPAVNTYPPEEALTTTAKLAGEVTSAGGGTIAASGICWSESHDPDINDNVTTDGIATGKFTSSISGLSANNTYYYRAYATNEAGTSYGDEFILVTSFGTVTDFEGNVYNTVKIGTQVWMRENLKSTKYSDGTDITGIFNSSGPADYGKLYTWQAALRNSNPSSTTPSGIQGACPVGWHVPSDPEFDLIWSLLGAPSADLSRNNIYLGGDLSVHIKAAGEKVWGSKPGDNSTGFTAIPGGGVWYNGSVLLTGELGMIAGWWTASINSGGGTISHSIGSSEHWIWVGTTVPATNSNGLSVRCIKD